jgi:methylated-DNA-protein-cysteine methyltransferase-like protein
MSVALFEQRVVSAIKKVPYGKVATYSQIAALAGSPRAALIVGQILRTKSDYHQLPWQRVINSKGRISIVNMEYPAELQAQLLVNEGIEVTKKDGSYWIDMAKYLWSPNS